MVVTSVVPPVDFTDNEVQVAIDARMSPGTIIRRAWEEQVIGQKMRSLLRTKIAESREKRPCNAMARPVRGRSSSAQGRGERSQSGEQVVPHQIRRCQCEAFVPSPPNIKKCRSCGHGVHDHQTLSKAEGHRIRREMVKEVVQQHFSSGRIWALLHLGRWARRAWMLWTL